MTRASDGDREITSTVWPLAMPIHVTERGVVGVAVPWLSKTMDTESREVSAPGMGDLSLFAKYVVVQIDRPRATLRVAPKGVVKLPTGNEDKIPALGSGSTDLSLGAVGAWLRGRLGLYTEGLYLVRGQSGRREFGEGLLYNIALAYRLLPVVYRTYPARQANLYLELNGLWTARDEVAGEEVHDSGGHVLFVSPGLQYIPFGRFLIEASLQMPAFATLNGAQPEPDWSANAGVRVLLF